MLPDAAALSATLNKAGVTGAEMDSAPIGLIVRTPVEQVLGALQALRDREEYAFLVDVFGVDTGEAIEVTYHLRSFTKDQEVRVRTTVPYDGEVSSAFGLYPSVLYSERELSEMFGVGIPGHPNPKRLLTSDNVQGYLLRKSTPVRTEEEVHERG